VRKQSPFVPADAGTQSNVLASPSLEGRVGERSERVG